MQIQKILMTPFSNSNNLTSNYYNKQTLKGNYNNGLKADSITFTAKTDDIVRDAFLKVASARGRKKLGEYMGLSGNVNVYLKELELGKKLQVALTNGKFKGKDFALFEISKASGMKTEYSDLSGNLSQNDVKLLTRTYLKDLK